MLPHRRLRALNRPPALDARLPPVHRCAAVTQRIPFIKMHGLGNDFVVLDAREQPIPPMTAAAARALADRRTGIGCDQIVLLEPGEVHAFRMRIFNSDGSEVERPAAMPRGRWRCCMASP